MDKDKCTFTHSQSAEDYLEAVLLLEKTGEQVRSVRIAETLGFSRSAVNQAMNELIAKGYIEKPAYGPITLTREGRELAESTYKRHTILKTFLLSIGVGEQAAEEDSCRIEHIVSAETLAALEKALSGEKA